MSETEIIRKLSDAALFEQLAEECTELSHAAQKMARKLRGENPTPKTVEEIHCDIIEELADVSNSLNVLLDLGLIDDISVDSIMEEKEKRWKDRLEKHFNEKGEN